MSSKYFPASIHKVVKENSLSSAIEFEYFFMLKNSQSDWKTTVVCSQQQLIDLRDTLNKLLNEASLAEKLHITEEQAILFEKKYKFDALCKNCQHQRTDYCKVCLLELDSPLERQLYLSLKEEGIYFKHQYPINRYGERANQSGVNYFDDLLTKVDFYITYYNKKICVYADGHTYHERTEEQALRDRNIDRQLQEMGYVVLRYTGKEIRDNSAKIIADIKRLIQKDAVGSYQ